MHNYINIQPPSSETMSTGADTAPRATPAVVNMLSNTADHLKAFDKLKCRHPEEFADTEGLWVSVCKMKEERHLGAQDLSPSRRRRSSLPKDKYCCRTARRYCHLDKRVTLTRHRDGWSSPIWPHSCRCT